MEFEVLFRGDVIGTVVLSAEGAGEPFTGALQVTMHYNRYRSLLRTPLPEAAADSHVLDGEAYGQALLAHNRGLEAQGLELRDQHGRIAPTDLVMISDLLPAEADPAQFPELIQVAAMFRETAI